MKLKNKYTDDVIDTSDNSNFTILFDCEGCISIYKGDINEDNDPKYEYPSLSAFCKDWEDCSTEEVLDGKLIIDWKDKTVTSNGGDYYYDVTVSFENFIRIAKYINGGELDEDLKGGDE